MQIKYKIKSLLISQIKEIGAVFLDIRSDDREKITVA